jgi:DNA-binding winged helix-turn-helix (wHTH) protein
MLSIRYFKYLRILIFLVLPVIVCLLPATPIEEPGDFSPDKINLALRRTADGLLRQWGDHTSRIPAIEQAGEDVWRVQLDQPFHYFQLPALLQESFDLYGISKPYEVAVRNCADATIELGYHQLDFLQNKQVPCGGRKMPEGCHYIEITFLERAATKPFLEGKGTGILLLIAGALAGYWLFRKQKSTPNNNGESNWIEFGNSKLDTIGQVLISAGVKHALTFRETKLLNLFAMSPDRLLEREFILQQVWTDEGVMVRRSIDVFVSRLRKKLSADQSVGIVAVHGVGYRLETGKSESV